MRLYRIVYHSLSTITEDDPDQLARELERILQIARIRNAAESITGALVYNKGTFVQVLEGPQLAVNRLLSSIVGDKRHRDVRLLEPTLIHARRFPSWSMGLVETSSTQKLLQHSTLLSRTEQNSLSLEELLDTLIGTMRQLA